MELSTFQLEAYRYTGDGDAFLVGMMRKGKDGGVVISGDSGPLTYVLSSLVDQLAKSLGLSFEDMIMQVINMHFESKDWEMPEDEVVSAAHKEDSLHEEEDPLEGLTFIEGFNDDEKHPIRAWFKKHFGGG